MQFEPTPEQIERYRADGFLVVPDWLDAREVEQVLGRFERAFAGEWETGLQPDEVNYEPGVTPPDRTRQLCNTWKSDRVLARTVLREEAGRWAGRLAGEPGMRLLHDNLIWKPPRGKSLLAHQDAAYTGFLDPPNMTTCWMALDDTARDTGTIYYVRGSSRWEHGPAGGQFHAPTTGSATCARWRRTTTGSSCRSKCRPGAQRSTTAGASTARRPTSTPTPSAGRSSATW
jgi:hypothetical protein